MIRISDKMTAILLPPSRFIRLHFISNGTCFDPPPTDDYAKISSKPTFGRLRKKLPKLQSSDQIIRVATRLDAKSTPIDAQFFLSLLDALMR